MGLDAWDTNLTILGPSVSLRIEFHYPNRFVPGRREGLGQSVDFLTKLSTKLSGKSGLCF